MSRRRRWRTTTTSIPPHQPSGSATQCQQEERQHQRQQTPSKPRIHNINTSIKSSSKKPPKDFDSFFFFTVLKPFASSGCTLSVRSNRGGPTDKVFETSLICLIFGRWSLIRTKLSGHKPWGSRWWQQGRAPSWRHWNINILCCFNFFRLIVCSRLAPGDRHVGKGDPLLLRDGEELHRPAEHTSCKAQLFWGRADLLTGWLLRSNCTWELGCQRRPLPPPGFPPRRPVWVTKVSD